MEIAYHIRQESVFDWSELRDRPLNPIGWSALVLLGTVPEPARRSRGPLGPKGSRVIVVSIHPHTHTDTLRQTHTHGLVSPLDTYTHTRSPRSNFYGKK